MNVLTSVDSAVYNSHNQLWYRIGKHFPQHKFFQYSPERTTIDNCRNLAAKFALEQECDYLMFIDDDMILHEMTFQSLMENIQKPHVDVVMALTYIRGYPFHPMCFIDRERDTPEVKNLDYFDDFQEYIDPKTHLVEVDAIGCACVMIKCSLISKLEAPYFVTTPHHTEDVYFCMKAKKTLGRKNVGIYVDCGVPTLHLMDKIGVGHRNVELLRTFSEMQNPDVAKFRNLKNGEKPDNPDRGVEYLANIDEKAPDYCETDEVAKHLRDEDVIDPRISHAAEIGATGSI